MFLLGFLFTNYTQLTYLGEIRKSGTKLGSIDIPAEDTKKLQTYWNAYRGSLAKPTAAEVSADILEVIREINGFLEQHRLLEAQKSEVNQ